MIAVPAFLVLVLVFAAFGDRLARLLGLAPGPAVERVSLSFSLSIGALTLLVFLLAAFHALTRWTCLGVAVLMGGAGAGPLRDGLRGLRAWPWRAWLWPAGRLDRILTLASAAFLGLGFLTALAPPTGLDAGVYHFAIPKLVVQSGGLVPREDVWIHKFGGFYMVYSFGMALGGEILAKLLAFGVAAAGVGLVAAVADRLRSGSGRAAAFILLATPISAGYLGYEYLELPILTYVLVSMLAILRGAEARAWTGVACAFAGLALSIKPSAFAVGILVPVSIGLMLKRDRAAGLVAASASGAAFGLAAGFWALWNYATTKSLIFKYPPTEPGAVDTVEDFPIGPGILRFLGKLATTGFYWTDSAGPLIIASLVGFGIFLRKSESRSALALCLVSLLAYVGGLCLASPWHLYSEFGPRYIAPCLVGFGVPVAAQFVSWARERPGPLRTAVVLALLLPAVPLLFLKAGKTAVAAPAALGLERRSAYLSKKVETFAACELLNNDPSPDVKVLFVAVRPYYLDRPYVWIPYTGGVPFLRGVKTREDFLRRVREEKITHVLYEPAVSRARFFADPDALFGAPFRELGRWPWKKDQSVRLYEVENR